METNKISLNTLLLSIIAVTLIEVVARIAISNSLLSQLTGLGLARFIQIFSILLISIKREGSLRSVGIDQLRIGNGFLRGLLWSAGFGISAALVFGVLILFGIDITKLFLSPLPVTSGNLIFFLCIATLLGPVSEEFFFRGILYGYLRKWGIPAAVILSTILFVLPHSMGPGIPITQLVGGLIFAVSYEVEKNLIVPIVIHCLGNLAIFTLGFLLS
jgi:membrane protease YdiL (CAAX protease family)